MRQHVLGVVVADQRRGLLVVLAQALFEHFRRIVLANRKSSFRRLASPLLDPLDELLLIDLELEHRVDGERVGDRLERPERAAAQVEQDPPGAAVEVGLDDDTLRLSVTDDGIGTAATHDPAREPGIGTGLMAKNVLRPERVLSPRQTEAFEQMVQHNFQSGIGTDQIIAKLDQLIAAVAKAGAGGVSVGSINGVSPEAARRAVQDIQRRQMMRASQ